MARASYRAAVRWIAINDEPGELDPDALQWAVTTLLIADIFGKEPLDVAKAIVRIRRKEVAS